LTVGLIALGAATAALVVVALSAAATRRARDASEQRITAALREMASRMDGLAGDLAVAIEHSRDDALRSRALGDLGGTLDLDEALARTADAAASVPGADAAVVRVAGLDGAMLVAAAGVARDEAERHVVTGPPDGRDARAVTLGYVYRDGEDPPGALRSGLVVPLEADGETIGTVAVFSHDPAPAPGADAVPRLEAIAAVAGPAIDTARRFREVRDAGDHDAVTGLPGRRSFHEDLAREVARAHRYERRLALLVLDVDDFHSVNDRLGQLGGDDVLGATAALVRGALREADVPFRTGGDEFAVVLPESARIDAEGLFARVLAAVRRHQTGLSLSGGIAELRPDDDALTLYERAEEALQRAKDVGKGTAA
jgi:diguanylate cyclase (GGDEF)-like protein